VKKKSQKKSAWKKKPPAFRWMGGTKETSKTRRRATRKKAPLPSSGRGKLWDPLENPSRSSSRQGVGVGGGARGLSVAGCVSINPAVWKGSPETYKYSEKLFKTGEEISRRDPGKDEVLAPEI